MLFLFVNPFLDIIGGVYIKLAEDIAGLPSVTPSLVVRMLMLLLFAAYVVMRKNWKAVAVMVPIALAWLLSLAGEIMYYYSISLYTDMQYIVRFAFNIAVILVYAMVFKNSALNRKALFDYINKTFIFTSNILSLTIILSYIFDVGYSTYGDRFGYRGSRGFFYSGNDITAVLMLLLPMTFCIFFQLSKKSSLKKVIWNAAAPATTLVALLLIGTKTAFMAVGGSCVAMLGYAVFQLIREKKRGYIIRFAIVILAFAIIFGALMLVSGSLVSDIRESLTHTGDVLSEGGVQAALLSGRQHKLQKAFSMLKRTTPYSVLFGVGRGTQPLVIEMDIFEVLIYYGIFGGIVMLWLYLKLGLGFLFKAFKRFDLTGLALLVSIGLCVGYLVMAGHVLFSVTSGFYFALMLVYAHLYYSSSPRKLKVI